MFEIWLKSTSGTPLHLGAHHSSIPEPKVALYHRISLFNMLTHHSSRAVCTCRARCAPCSIGVYRFSHRGGGGWIFALSANQGYGVRVSRKQSLFFKFESWGRLGSEAGVGSRSRKKNWSVESEWGIGVEKFKILTYFLVFTPKWWNVSNTKSYFADIKCCLYTNKHNFHTCSHFETGVGIERSRTN